MVAPFLHYEVLGPRENLDVWLGSIQDVGVCHLADALADLEGEADIGRPAPTAEEIHAQLIRSEASRGLRGIERVLPPTPRSPRAATRPTWSVGAGRQDEHAVMALKDEAREIAGIIRAALESVRAAEEEVLRLDALATAFRLVLAEGGQDGATAPCRIFSTTGGFSARKLARRLARRGERILRAPGDRSHVVVLPAGATLPDEVDAVAAALGADSIPLPEDLRGRAPADAAREVAESMARALREEGDVRATLTARVGEYGERGRFLLDSLEDADARMAARRTLAATEHVVAARVFVRPEDEPALRERIRQRHGDTLALRPLAEADDAPSLPRRVAPVPLGALRGLTPARYGTTSLTSLLALLTPLAVGIAWADVAGGLLLLLAGAILQSRAGVGSPRRDTALLAQMGGLVALGLGVLRGAAFGPAGESWFGASWGLLGDWPLAAGLPFQLQPFVAVLAVLGCLALLAAVWGGGLAAWSARHGHPARARANLVASLHYVVVAGLAAAALGPTSAVHGAWVLAPGAALGVLLLAGPRAFLARLCLDLVGVLRLVAVAGGALLVFHLVLAGWVSPGAVDLLVGPLALLVASLAIVADAAHLAMGVPYDLALGGGDVGRPFDPFRRRQRAGGV